MELGAPRAQGWIGSREQMLLQQENIREKRAARKRQQEANLQTILDRVMQPEPEPEEEEEEEQSLQTFQNFCSQVSDLNMLGPHNPLDQRPSPPHHISTAPDSCQGRHGAASESRASLQPRSPELQAGLDQILRPMEQQEEVEVEPPTQEDQDEIAFIFNNLTAVNLKLKALAMRRILAIDESELSSSWLAHRLVQRAGAEPNYQALYSRLLGALGSPRLEGAVERETLRRAAHLLRAGPASSGPQRAVLGSLGRWLGLLTLGRERPVALLDLEQLLSWAERAGQQELGRVVSFVAKVLGAAALSTRFLPPHPWTAGLLGRLAALHRREDTRLNIKFQVEVLYRTLGLQDLVA